MRTLKDLKKDIDKMLELHPNWASLPLITSSDDEGNSYNEVVYSIEAMQMRDINDYNLEVVGQFGHDTIAEEDINCICIN